jgi:hypothetical protein
MKKYKKRVSEKKRETLETIFVEEVVIIETTVGTISE